MSKEQKSLLITIILAIVATVIILGAGGVVNAAPPKKVTVYHRDGTVEVFNDVDSVQAAATDFKTHTSVIIIKKGEVIYRLYNSEVVIEESTTSKIT